MPEKTSAFFFNSPACDLLPSFTGHAPRVAARYPAANPLQSGWLSGGEFLENKAAVVEMSHGKGRVVLLGFRAQFRAQPHATFKLLFNALHWSAAKPEARK